MTKLRNQVESGKIKKVKVLLPLSPWVYLNSVFLISFYVTFFNETFPLCTVLVRAWQICVLLDVKCEMWHQTRTLTLTLGWHIWWVNLCTTQLQHGYFTWWLYKLNKLCLPLFMFSERHEPGGWQSLDDKCCRWRYDVTWHHDLVWSMFET